MSEERAPENDAWGERPEDVLLCLYEDESGYCCLPYEHDGRHVLSPGSTDAPG